jgi:hypothetical protein
VNIFKTIGFFLYKNEYRIFKHVELTIRWGLSRREKIRGDEQIWVIIHIYIEMPQGNSLCSYLKQAKMSFFFYKIGEQESRTSPVLGVIPVCVGEDVGRG